MFNGRGKPHLDFVLVAGCSRAGARIASILSAKGKDVVVLDRDKASFRKLSPDFSGFTIASDVTDVDALKHAGIAKADVVFAATDDDNTNIMVAEIASALFNVPRIFTRLYDADKEVLYRDYPVDIIYPTRLIVEEFQELMAEGGTKN